jgi:uncharacterized membrane protein
MGKDRLAAFSDGVIAIIVTIAARLGLDGANGSDSKFRKLCFELYYFDPTCFRQIVLVFVFYDCYNLTKAGRAT